MPKPKHTAGERPTSYGCSLNRASFWEGVGVSTDFSGGIIEGKDWQTEVRLNGRNRGGRENQAEKNEKSSAAVTGSGTHPCDGRQLKSQEGPVTKAEKERKGVGISGTRKDEEKKKGG